MRCCFKRTARKRSVKSALTSGSNVSETERKRWKMNRKWATLWSALDMQNYRHDGASARNAGTRSAADITADGGGAGHRQRNGGHHRSRRSWKAEDLLPFRTTQTDSRTKGKTNGMGQRFQSPWPLFFNNHRWSQGMKPGATSTTQKPSANRWPGVRHLRHDPQRVRFKNQR